MTAQIPGGVPGYGIPTVGAGAEAQAKEQGLSREAYMHLVMSEFEPLYDSYMEGITGKVLDPAVAPSYMKNYILPNKDIIFFKNGIGKAGDGYAEKTIAQTNLPEVGIPKGQRWLITDVGVWWSINLSPNTTNWQRDGAMASPATKHFSGDSYAGALELINNIIKRDIGSFSALIYNKSQIKRILGKTFFYPAGYGLDADAQCNPSIAAMYARKPLKRPILLEQQDSFDFTLVRPKKLEYLLPSRFDPITDVEQEADTDTEVLIEYHISLWGYHDYAIPQ